MTETERAELRQLASAASPGPWVAWHPEDAGTSSWLGKAQIANLPQPSADRCSSFLRGDAAFIAAARAAVPLLLDTLKAAERNRDRLRLAVRDALPYLADAPYHVRATLLTALEESHHG